MGYIGSGPTRFNTADELTVTGDAEFNGNLTVKGTTTTIDSASVQTVDLGDNDKIRLGDGDDLQIYHNGSASDIKETGTGNLRIWGDDIQFFNSAGSKYHAQMITDGAITLYYNGAEKLSTTATGVDVTGTVTADGLTVDGATTVNDADLLLNGGSPEIIFQTGASHYNWMIAAQENVSNALEISSGSQDADYSNDTFTPRFVISSAGNVGIGTTSPTHNLTIGSAAASDFVVALRGGVGGFFGWDDSANTTVLQSPNTRSLSFQVNSDTFSSGSEAMRLSNAGRWWVGQAIGTTLGGNGAEAATGIMHASNSANGYTVIQSNGSNNPLYVANGPNKVGAGLIHFGVNGSNVGGISSNGTTTSYNETSDYRLKENVIYDWDATTRLKQLKPAQFNFISTPDETRDGFLAHELQEVSPQSVTGTKDAMMDEEYEVTPAVLDEDGNEVTPAVMGTRSVPDYQSIDQSKLVPLLVKTIQELEARIVALETA
jgi:hypothetical protein